ncbi:MAG: hypothetical protein WCC37_12725 [Candidatus Sulfotelmatobacter sp.]|jgi:hypothetical protein
MTTPAAQELIERDDQDERELAKKLAAACITHRLGLKSIDYVRKTYLKGNHEVGSVWIELARQAKKIHPTMDLMDLPVGTNLKQ